MDLRSPYYAGEYFLESQVGQWVKENCWDFGFILRYPEEQEEATGITYEPWHYRYVGLPHSLIMEENGFILEDYLFSLPTGTVITWENWGILAVDEEEDASFSLPAGFKNAWISPDNTGRYILWWEQ